MSTDTGTTTAGTQSLLSLPEHGAKWVTVRTEHR
jgi:hypothetical protein